MIYAKYEYTMYTGEIVTLTIPIPLDECRLRQKIEKDYKRRGGYGGNPRFEYKLSEAELDKIRREWMSHDLFSNCKVSLR